MQLWNLQSNEKTRAKRKLNGSTPEGSDPKDSPTTTTTFPLSWGGGQNRSVFFKTAVFNINPSEHGKYSAIYFMAFCSAPVQLIDLEFNLNNLMNILRSMNIVAYCAIKAVSALRNADSSFCFSDFAFFKNPPSSIV